jgi:small ligand-binding sensory domain FIST
LLAPTVRQRCRPFGNGAILRAQMGNLFVAIGGFYPLRGIFDLS